MLKLTGICMKSEYISDVKRNLTLFFFKFLLLTTRYRKQHWKYGSVSVESDTNGQYSTNKRLIC